MRGVQPVTHKSHFNIEPTTAKYWVAHAFYVREKCTTFCARSCKEPLFPFLLCQFLTSYTERKQKGNMIICVLVLKEYFTATSFENLKQQLLGFAPVSVRIYWPLFIDRKRWALWLFFLCSALFTKPRPQCQAA